MTEKLPSLSTHSVTPSQATVLSPKIIPSLLHNEPSKTETVEEEPYTIKCICDFTDDDGNTIYCESCDTWQHIECFYPHNIQDAYREDFSHFCADCRPRLLDRQRAAERQRGRQHKVDSNGGPDKTKKRLPAKGQKKKAKPTDLHINGHGAPDVSTKQNDQNIYQHKKSKSTHRTSQSLGSQNPKKSPPIGHKQSNPHGHPPSPATTPPDIHQELEIHNYSNGFLSLYKDDCDVATVKTNSFASLVISNHLSSWLRDPDKLESETGQGFDDVFQNLPSNIDSIKGDPKVERKKLPISPDTVLHWQYLTTPKAIEKDVPLVELNGQLGIQKEYCEDPENRWADLSCPLPFVFFHPTLPLYIDTRKEGSVARYVRRSCKPNTKISTFLSSGSEYHFWLVSDRNIAPNEQITIPWGFRLPNDGARMLQLLGLQNEDSDGPPEYDNNEAETYRNIAHWIYTVLSEYGGCACDMGPDCAFTRFNRTYIQRSSPRIGLPKKKPRKPKSHNLSPTSTGHSVNGRAPSEGHGDGDDDSGSSRSKPPSRDMTPAPRQGSFDTLGVLTELTDRDKRKVQMVEDSFRRMEQQQPPRKKKRTSDGNSSSGNSTKQKSRTPAGHSSSIAAGTSDRRYVDASTSRRVSGSQSPAPASNFRKTSIVNSSSSMAKMALQHHVRPVYRDACVQTDPVEGEWYDSAPRSPNPKKRVVSLSRRLLASRHRFKTEEQERRGSSIASPGAVASALVKMDLDSPSDRTPPMTSPTTEHETTAVVSPVDTDMKDQTVESPAESKASITIERQQAPGTTIKSPELRVELPQVPSLNGVPGPPSVTEASPSITAAPTQSPLLGPGLSSAFAASTINGAVAQPSPVKKKLSLSDYTKSRLNKAALGRSTSASVKTPHTISEYAKSPTSVDAIMVESPIGEKSTEA